MSDRITTEFLNLIDTAHDFISTGYRKNHSQEKSAQKADSLELISQEIAACKKCRLCETRIKTVPGEGTTNPKVMIIGEAPGAQEDKTGIPFVGRAGQYMDKWMDAINLKRGEDLFIGNIVKCRPPNNRDPYPDEITACRGYLERQIHLLHPKLILSVGRIAIQFLTGSTSGIGRLRGKMYEFKGIPVIPTYHPSGVLRNPGEYRKPVWEDLQKVKEFLDKNEIS